MTGVPPGTPTIEAFWDRDGLGLAILDALAATGRPREALTVDDLAPFDQFHGGGKAATERLARLGRLAPGEHVLDVGGGLGGPARTLAVQCGCFVTVVDLAPSYVRAGAELTALLGLGDRVTHVCASALALPFDAGSFDVVWTQNSGMNIDDKEAMVAGFHRVLRRGGRYVFQEPMAGPLQPPHYPLMWAQDATMNFLRTPAQMRALVEAAGYRVLAWEDVTPQASGGRAPPGGHSIQSLVMGERLTAIAESGRRNADEGRVLMMQAVFERM